MSEKRLIAVSAEGDRGLDSPVCGRFGRAPYFCFVEEEAGELGECRCLANPYFEDHRPGRVPLFIKKQGADVIISGRMGPSAAKIFDHHGIEVATGASGTVREAVAAFLTGGMKGRRLHGRRGDGARRHY
ncbi:MAG TPA: NifB/NifX family molybdenum-iron cluster-binding protein [bacterium]|nr:NifB/NifX family molybdenum-iron cluster-binding protein [bacterium]